MSNIYFTTNIYLLDFSSCQTYVSHQAYIYNMLNHVKQKRTLQSLFADEEERQSLNSFSLSPFFRSFSLHAIPERRRSSRTATEFNYRRYNQRFSSQFSLNRLCHLLCLTFIPFSKRRQKSGWEYKIEQLPFSFLKMFYFY